MERHSHIIGQQVFEVDFSSHSRGHELQNKISSLFNRRLLDEMASLFDRTIPENKILRVDNLTINIGTIKFEALDDEFVDKIIEKLESEVSLLLLHDNSAVDVDTEKYSNDKSGSYLSLIEYFLLKGTLPWWASSENATTPFLAFEFLLKQSADSLIKLLMRIGQKSYVRRRLVYQFSEEQIKSLIQVMEPAEAEFIFDYHSEIVKVQRQKQLIKNEESEFKKAVWEFILTYLIVDRGSHFNRKEFVKSTLVGIAANFNVSFDGLLNLFAASLVPGSTYLKNVDSLQTIIFEIAVEQGTRIKMTSALDEILEIPVDTPESGIDLLRYYLTFGSFPWWSINVTEIELEALIVNMIKKYPRTIESLVKSVGQQQYSRQLIVKTFKEDTLHSILMIIEPENAEFIIDYVEEIKITHTKKTLFKTQTSDLHQAVWEFILEYLLIDRGSEFNRQVFLESNITKLASRFNLSYKDLLVFMVNNIAVVHQNSSRHLHLFQGLTSLYSIYAKKQKLEDQMKEGGELFSDLSAFPDIFDTGERKAIQKVKLLNVLYFWIRTGYKPWWAAEYMSVSTAVMIERLLDESASEALVFLKHAGLQVKMRKRLVYQVPFQILLSLFQLLPSGIDIKKYSLGLLVLIRSSKTIRYSDSSISERIMLFSLWEALIDSSYSVLKPVQFVRSVILKHALWFQIPVKRIIDSIKIDQQDELKAFIDEAYLNIEEQKISGDVYDQQLLEDWSDSNSIEQILMALLSKKVRVIVQHPNEEQKTQHAKEDLLKEASSILLFFLESQKLPDHIQIHSQSSINAFLKQILLFLHREAPSELKNILNSDKYRGENFLRIHEIFSISNSIAESSLSSVLKTYLEKDILLFIEQNGKLEHGGRSMLALIDSYIDTPDNLQTMQFLKQLFKYSSVSMQLAYYYKNEITYKLISNNFTRIGWGSQTNTFLKSFNNWMMEMVHDQLDRERLDLLFRTFNFIMIGGEVRAGSLRAYLNHFFAFLFERDYQLMLKLASIVQKPASEKTTNDLMISNSINEIRLEIEPYVNFKEVSSELTQMLAESDAMALERINPDIKDHKDLEKKLLAEEAEQQRSEDDRLAEKDGLTEKDTIYIKNAGLVILHPFLSTYFKRLEMLENGDFINDDMRHRAVHLLQYLAFGTETNEEHELVLNKILCNIPVEEPIMPGIELTEQERTISAELLNAVIIQWDKMKNSTAESFQASFLQRDGGLYKVEENWNLKVEERGYDVILTTLPWGLGMVKTPWMTDFIYVEWM